MGEISFDVNKCNFKEIQLQIYHNVHSVVYDETSRKHTDMVHNADISAFSHGKPTKLAFCLA